MSSPVVLFDLDGTLLDTGEHITASANAARAHYGLAPLSRAACLQWVGKGSHWLVQNTVSAHVSDATHDAIYAVFKAAYLQNPTLGVTAYEGVWEALAWLRQRGARLGILTNKPHDVTERVVEAIGLGDAVDAVLGAGGPLPTGPAPAKPDPAGIEWMLAQLGSPPKSAVTLVGDGVPDVEVAQRAGVRSVAIWGGFTPIELLEAASPDHLVPRFADAFEVLKRVL